jgi:CBS domain-containing protein
MIKRLTVNDVMTHLVVTFRPSDRLRYVAHKLLHNRISGAPVTEGGRLVGIITETDIADGAVSGSLQGAEGVLDKTVGELMTRRVFVSHPGDSIPHAAALLDRHGVRRVPVVDDENYVIGVIGRADIIRAIAVDHPAEALTA